MMKFALAAATLVAVLCVHADAQTCPPGYKSAAGACVHTCPEVMRIQAVPVSIVDREEAEALDQPSACGSRSDGLNCGCDVRKNNVGLQRDEFLREPLHRPQIGG